MGMEAEKDLDQLLKTMRPRLNRGEFVFCTVKNISAVNISKVVMLLKEQEGVTLIVEKQTADELALTYSFVAAWITLSVHSSLEAVGLTAAFSNALAARGISCNVVAGFYHDHIFVNLTEASLAMEILHQLSAT